MQEPDSCLPRLTIGATQPIHDDRSRPVEFPRLFKRDAVLGKIALSLGGILDEEHYL